MLTHKPSIAAYRAPGRAADDLRDRLPDGADRAARSALDPGRVPRCATSQRQGDPMANNQPWASNGAAEVLEPTRRAPIWKERAEWKASAQGRHAARRRASRSAAGSAGFSRPAPPCSSTPTARLQRADGPGRHRGHQHRARADRRHRVRRRHREGEDHHRRHRRGADDRAQRRQQDHLHGRRRR